MMRIEKLTQNDAVVASVHSEEVIMKDLQSALDLIMNISYEAQSNLIVINKEAIADKFFVLSSGLAGEILQKFINYHTKIAIYGDYSKYTSKPLKDFIYESNKGKDVFFVATKKEAIDKLVAAI